MNNRNDRSGRNYNYNQNQQRPKNQTYSPNGTRAPQQVRVQNDQRMSQPGANQTPTGNERGGFNAYILIELLLLVFASAAALMFCSFLMVDYHFDFVETVNPTLSIAAPEGEPEDRLYEREIPVKPEVPTDTRLEYDFSQPVPECDAYPLDYFNDTIFIGDSRTAGLIMYTKLRPIDCSATGFNLNNFSSKKYITYVDEEGKKSLVTCSEALELYKGKYKSIYLSTGVNELGWNASMFIKAYRNVIDSIREITDVPIYIQLILPVTVDYAKKSTNGITNEKQVQFNEKLLELILDEKVFMLDPLSLFSLEDGTLDPEKTYDGAHLEKFACAELLEYYQTHVVDTEIYSNLTNAAAAEDITGQPN